MIRKELNYYDKNLFDEIKNRKAVITAGGKNGFNLTTVLWGSMGMLWDRSVVTIYMRPSKKTWEYIEKNPKLTVSFFKDEFKDQVNLAGKISGHDYADKYKEIGFTPIYDVDADVYYPKEASYVFKLTKLYVGDIKKGDFFDETIRDTYYKDGDYHKFIICQINQYLINED